MKSFRLLFLLAPLFLAGCGLTPQEKADYARVERSGVSPAIYDKMVHGDDLGISDVESLARAHVSSAVILRYIRSHDTVYYLHSADVTALQKAGVDPSVIDYMLQSARQYGPGAYGYPYPYGYTYDPFWYPGLYGGFGWYNGGYFGPGGGGYYGHHHH